MLWPRLSCRALQTCVRRLPRQLNNGIAPPPDSPCLRARPRILFNHQGRAQQANPPGLRGGWRGAASRRASQVICALGGSARRLRTAHAVALRGAGRPVVCLLVIPKVQQRQSSSGPSWLRSPPAPFPWLTVALARATGALPNTRSPNATPSAPSPDPAAPARTRVRSLCSVCIRDTP